MPDLVERGGDGRHVAIDSNPVYGWKSAAGSLYQNHLQRPLSAELGVAWGPDRPTPGRSPGSPGAVAKVLEAQRPDRGRARSRGRRLRGAGSEDAGGRGGVDRDPGGQGPHADAREPHRAVARRSRGGRPAGRGRLGTPRWARPPPRSRRAGRGTRSWPNWSTRKAACAPTSPRFTEADVIEHLCALSGGAWVTEEVLALAQRFLNSEHAVRLTPTAELGQPGRPGPRSGRRPCTAPSRTTRSSCSATSSSGRPRRRSTTNRGGPRSRARARRRRGEGRAGGVRRRWDGPRCCRPPGSERPRWCTWPPPRSPPTTGPCGAWRPPPRPRPVSRAPGWRR